MSRTKKDGQQDKRFKSDGSEVFADLIVWIGTRIPWWVYLIGGLYLLYNWQFNEEVLSFEHEIVNGIEQTVSVDLNVREKPNNSAKILSVLSKSSKVIVSDELIKGWVLVANKDTIPIGYVFDKYLIDNE